MLPSAVDDGDDGNGVNGQLCFIHSSTYFLLHETTSIDILIVEHVADHVISTMSRWEVAMPVSKVVAMPVIVVTLFELICCVFKVFVDRSEVQWRIGVGPEFSPLSSPPHLFQHLVPVDVPNHRYLLHFSIHLHRIDPYHTIYIIFALANVSIKQDLVLKCNVCIESNTEYTFKLVNGVFYYTLATSAAHPHLELHSLYVNSWIFLVCVNSCVPRTDVQAPISTE